MVRFLALGAAALVLAACSDAEVAGDKGAAPADAAPAGVPASAIAVGDDVYMVPLGPDAEGCAMFRVFSPTKAVVQAIHYRTADGAFVMNKQDAQCG